MSHSDSSDSSMDMDMGPACKINMLWNWYTVDSCFITTDWHVRSNGIFALSVIALFFLVALIEGVRRLSREYDRRLVLHARYAWKNGTLPTVKGSTDDSVFEFKPTWSQQFVRAVLFTIQFGAAYIIMLIAMYYNGFMIFAIILGGGFGYFIFGKDTVAVSGPGEQGGSCC